MNKFIVCEHCKADLLLEDVLRERQIRENLYEIGLQCPCGIWTHSFFTCTSLKERAAKLDEMMSSYQRNKTPATWEKYKTMQAAYKFEFDTFNRRWRRKFNMLGKLS